MKVGGEWKYLYRAVDKKNNTIDFLLTAKRDRKAARSFIDKAIGGSGVPAKINIDKSGANTAARPTLGFKAFYSAQATLAGVEAARMIAKGQLRPKYSKGCSAVDQCHAIAA